MLMRQGLRVHLMQAPAKRTFHLLIDPECLPDLMSKSYSNVLQLILDLRLIEPAVNFILLAPDEGASREPLCTVIHESVDPVAFSPANVFENDPRNRLLDSDEKGVRLRALCGLCVQHKVDGIVTTSAQLIDARYPLYQHDVIRIVPLNEFADFVEVCAHGHGIFWSASYQAALTQDTYYTLAHHKGARVARWFPLYQPRDPSVNVREDLRSLLLNRYPFILYARDMVLFFQMQKDSSTRNGRIQNFNVPLSYHMNCFYLLLWGMLEHLCLVANSVFQLGLSPKACTRIATAPLRQWPSLVLILSSGPKHSLRFAALSRFGRNTGYVSEFKHFGTFTRSHIIFRT